MCGSRHACAVFLASVSWGTFLIIIEWGVADPNHHCNPKLTKNIKYKVNDLCPTERCCQLSFQSARIKVSQVQRSCRVNINFDLANYNIWWRTLISVDFANYNIRCRTLICVSLLPMRSLVVTGQFSSHVIDITIRVSSRNFFQGWKWVWLLHALNRIRYFMSAVMIYG